MLLIKILQTFCNFSRKNTYDNPKLLIIFKTLIISVPIERSECSFSGKEYCVNPSNFPLIKIPSFVQNLTAAIDINQKV